MRNHIRPAMSYLNAVGGSVVIDCLSQEEITNIFSDAITAIMQGDTPSLNLEGGVEDIDYSADDEQNLESEPDELEVILGCKVVIHNTDDETKTFKYDLMNGALPKALEVFTGHKVGDIIEMLGKEWKIVDVIL